MGVRQAYMQLVGILEKAKALTGTSRTSPQASSLEHVIDI